jgi:hypothetical protein
MKSSRRGSADYYCNQIGRNPAEVLSSPQQMFHVGQFSGQHFKVCGVLPEVILLLSTRYDCEIEYYDSRPTRD